MAAEDRVEAGAASCDARAPMTTDRDPRPLEEPLDGRLFERNPCWGCSPTHPFGLRLELRREGDEVVTEIQPSEMHQGPPGLMHGGLVFALADEVGAWAVLAATSKFGFTAAFEGKLLKPVRIGQPIEARGRIVKASRRVVDTAVRVIQGGSDVLAAQVRFVLVDESGAERLLGGPVPEAWKRFSR